MAWAQSGHQVWLEIARKSGISSGMNKTITLGKAGRLVVPKPVRDRLGLREGSRLRIEVVNGRFEAVPEPDDVQIVVRDGFPVIVGAPSRSPGETARVVQADRAAREGRFRQRRDRA
jgi:AbrB family looped-hinge helix DNA binding protein